MTAALQGETDFEFSAADFERVRSMIYRHAGISLNPNKQTMVYSRLSRRLRTLRLASFKSYLDGLESGDANAPEWQEFVNALTTNLTSFYREAHHFPILAELAQRVAAQGRNVNVWCCAASTGEEPYTIAMTLAEALRGTGGASILATDIDTNVLARGEQGVYPMENAGKIDPALLKRWFLRGTGANAGQARVKPELRRMIEFRQLNLLDRKWPMTTRFDAIFCRNVMIYFDKDTQYQVLRGLHQHLTPDGCLFAGHSENFTQARDIFELEGRTVYRPVNAPARRAA